MAEPKAQNQFMRKLVVAAAGAVLLVALADTGRAAGAAHRRHYAQRSHRPVPPAVRAPRRPDEAWHAHDSGALPFGSGRWWEQMLREGRINGDTM